MCNSLIVSVKIFNDYKNKIIFGQKPCYFMIAPSIHTQSLYIEAIKTSYTDFYYS